MNVPQTLINAATAAAKAHQLDQALVCAVVEQESTWNQWAMRYEPAFYLKYVADTVIDKKVSPSEGYARAFSWGLMQIMGQTAREFGFGGAFLSMLCDPIIGLDLGCRKLRKCMDNAAGDVPKALLAYNGGSNPSYAAEVMARISHYQLANNAANVQQAASEE